MFCKVYTANKEGQSLPDEAVRRCVVHGELELRQRPRYGATLCDPYTGRYRLPVLDVTEWRVMREGMLLIGIEVVPRRNTSKSAVDRWPQKWWCVPTIRPAPAPTPQGRDREIDKMVRAIGKMQ